MEILIYELTCDIFKNVEKQKRHFNKLLKKNNKILLLLFCTTLFNFPAIDYFINGKLFFTIFAKMQNKIV
ncbi:hypothetical protein PFAG_04948 [Plasmodium falciparum Santa Lucia]|uniref:Uncharacterized protein n=7 Tax=Plasmodium falciparum TaxID=5833 RepID=A0A024W1D5_PLAFA|nr:hypothetical protein PFFVO_04491 [Plasmodium falciparum Vietnam Oak-Knoll (FVO)]ETW34492.1 hypothetical protein PFTANZ_04816 [Plasmodium falciparum Tanzania (2000708)]ETW40752.1 hypothetical protein PFNF135_05055 [Plasmodium falciparum NF135/5.C10]ETW59360.1 hypothetical protein PFMC_04836 [Plasmodium falciparum CAMP/Malaysia]EUR65295.1 hypothetical protein PFBG_04910 [Plasmodium falciparum 7G8]EUT80307.1 hypothetical protein PFAG_04948 [Plasmodium falciparum Santa Lucia]EWC74346.1 hypothe